MTDWSCLCHFSGGDEGVYALHHDWILRGSRVTITGLDGVWIVTELEAPDEAEVHADDRTAAR